MYEIFRTTRYRKDLKLIAYNKKLIDSVFQVPLCVYNVKNFKPFATRETSGRGNLLLTFLFVFFFFQWFG